MPKIPEQRNNLQRIWAGWGGLGGNRDTFLQTENKIVNKKKFNLLI